MTRDARSRPSLPPEPQPLVLTGERTLPGITEETYWFCRHVAGYRWAIEATAGCPSGAVLDSGCGEGYGTAALAAARAGSLVVGVDLFADAARHAGATYAGDAAAFACADTSSLPFADAAFAAVVSLQVIEHLEDPDRYVAEVARVLAPGGIFACATPNRLTFTPEGRPKNPFHIVEFSGDELTALLGAHMSGVEVSALGDRFPGLADDLMDSALAGTPPPPRAAALVPTVTPDDFCVHDDVDAGLDLLAWCSR
ncbi:MAG: class I SAM-dependent methyltransferase [Acidimicrobiia bacterium]|nr:class I SAM-dependent methyltransferase [Acidimicrobiia bacterium]